jgi:hypothetical protein
MTKKTRSVLILSLALLAGLALVAVSQATPGDAVPTPWPDGQDRQGGAPSVVAYQGEVRLDGAPYTGDGYFKFAVVDAAGKTLYWSNDGSGGPVPSAAVPLPVSRGLFSVLLGDTSLSGMSRSLAASVFDEPDRYLRVWFSTNDSGPFTQLAEDTRIAAVPYALQAERVHGYAGVVVVAKSGGDYTGVQAAIDSVTGATAANPYLVWVAPGVYEEQVTMVPHVHLQGAGQETTVISSSVSSGAWPATDATLKLASDTSLRDLTVANGGTGQSNAALMATAGTTRTLVADVTARAQEHGTYNYALFLAGSGTGVTLQQVTALAENGTGANYGLFSRDGAVATLRGGAFTARGGNGTRAIYNDGSGTRLEAQDITALGENGSGSNYGLENRDGAAATLHGGAFTARGGTHTYGISSDNSGTTLEATSVTALGENSSSINYGLFNDGASAAVLRGGSFTARGGTTASGIRCYGNFTTLEATSVTALAENATGWNNGLSNNGNADTILWGGSFTGDGGDHARGIHNDGSGSTLEANNVTARGRNGTTENHGLRNVSSATANVAQSVLGGLTHSVSNPSGGSVIVSNSRLVGGVPSTNVTCVGVSWETTFYADTCPPGP